MGENTKQINYKGISDNEEVIDLIKQKLELEKKIKELDEFALILLELQLLDLDT
jgi:hypothetical protein